MRTKINQRGLKGTVAALLTTYFLAVALSALAQCPPRGTEYFDGVTPPAPCLCLDQERLFTSRSRSIG